MSQSVYIRSSCVASRARLFCFLIRERKTSSCCSHIARPEVNWFPKPGMGSARRAFQILNSLNAINGRKAEPSDYDKSSYCLPVRSDRCCNPPAQDGRLQNNHTRKICLSIPRRSDVQKQASASKLNRLGLDLYESEISAHRVIHVSSLRAVAGISEFKAASHFVPRDATNPEGQ